MLEPEDEADWDWLTLEALESPLRAEGRRYLSGETLEAAGGASDCCVELPGRKADCGLGAVEGTALRVPVTGNAESSRGPSEFRPDERVLGRLVMDTLAG